MVLVVIRPPDLQGFAVKEEAHFRIEPNGADAETGLIRIDDRPAGANDGFQSVQVRRLDRPYPGMSNRELAGVFLPVSCRENQAFPGTGRDRLAG